MNANTLRCFFVKMTTFSTNKNTVVLGLFLVAKNYLFYFSTFSKYLTSFQIRTSNQTILSKLIASKKPLIKCRMLEQLLWIPLMI